ncbi:MAG: HAMP domain-containing sensor histidine kinase [Ignavibacteriales bacterium]|nr:HAMP domain-containing sensor histidine kinase [Ignavibacteriales bacterium]
MFKINRQHNVLRSLAAVLLLLVLLPAVFFTAYEVSSLSQSEKLVERTYRQQLDAALFSVNQYAWDIADGWAREINRILWPGRAPATPPSAADFTSFLSSSSGIRALFLVDSAGRAVTLSASRHEDTTSTVVNKADVLKLIRSEQSRITRLSRLEETGYRKIEGVSVENTRGEQHTGLLFIARAPANVREIVIIILDPELFVRNSLRQKLDETAGTEFILSVVRNSDGQQVYATESLYPGDERQTKELWLFPGYTLGIRMHGETIKELARDRFYRNLALLVALDIMILLGAWFLYRTVRREMELARMQSDFVSNVSHELRTPLSLIRMFGETLEMGRVPSEEKKQEYYSTIVRETERLTGLINNVLSFSRIESGNKAYHLTPVDINSVVTQVLASYQSQFDHLGYAAEKEFVHPLPDIMADSPAVAEALLNIIDNAMKYAGAEKWIKLRTGRTAQSVYVEVHDNGIGIAEQDQAKIFEKFYRVSTGLTHEVRGSGLGLTLVRHIMDAHHGEVTVESRPGMGSTFRLSFPIVT